MAVSFKYRELVQLGWQDRAACRTRDKELFFGPSDDGSVPRSRAEQKRIERAQKVCRECPVRLDCLNHAMMYPELWGIWGGMTQQARALLRNKVRKQRRRLA